MALRCKAVTPEQGQLLSLITEKVNIEQNTYGLPWMSRWR